MASTDITILDQIAAREAANDPRRDWIGGLRAIADTIENNPGVRHPTFGAAFTIYFPGSDAAIEMAAARRALGGTWRKQADEGYFRLFRDFGPHSVVLVADRNVVCTRVVTGVEQVEVPDPAAPKVLMDKEIVEWQCSPLLGDEGDVAS